MDTKSNKNNKEEMENKMETEPSGKNNEGWIEMKSKKKAKVRKETRSQSTRKTRREPNLKNPTTYNSGNYDKSK
jgi:hypothetical protein